MRTKEEYIQLLKDYKVHISHQFGIRSMGIFGSVARGEQQEGSDVDIYVETETPNPFLLLDLLLDLKVELEKLFGCPVDIVRLRQRMNHFLRSQIEKEGIYV